MHIKAWPLEAILVILGQRFLKYFVWKVLGKNKKNGTTSVWKRSSDHLGDSHMWEKALALAYVTFETIATDKRFLQNERRSANLPKRAPDY